jgi:hypothetical protein
MKNEQEHNGWTNYATWRVNLECFDDMESCQGMDADTCEEIVREHLESQSSALALDYAMAFVADVNWREIAEHLKEEE